MKKVILLSILFIFLVGCSRYNKKGIEKNDLGLDYYSDNNLEKALELFIEASEEEHIPMYFINQGVVLIDLKEYKKSLKAFEEAININDGSLEEAYFGSGIASMYLGKYEEALDYFELTLDEKPDYLEGYLHKARVEQKIGKVEKVINTYNKALEIFPNEKKVFYEKGLFLNIIKQYEEAVKSFDKTLEIDDKFGLAFNHRGISYLNLGETELAKADFDKAKELLEEDEIDIYYGKYYESIGEGEKALDIYNETIKSFNNGKAYLFRGQIYYNNKDTNKAINDFKDAQEKGEYEASAYLGNIYYEQKNYKEARDNFNKYIENDQSSPWIYNRLGLINIELKDYESSLMYFQKANELEPKDIEILFNIASTYEFLNDYEKAKIYIEKILDIQPNDSEAIRELTYINSKLND